MESRKSATDSDKGIAPPVLQVNTHFSLTVEVYKQPVTSLGDRFLNGNPPHSGVQVTISHFLSSQEDDRG